MWGNAHNWDDTIHTAGVIHGLMGLFKMTTDCSEANALERKVLEAYAHFRNDYIENLKLYDLY